jgi:hypothetical protein
MAKTANNDLSAARETSQDAENIAAPTITEKPQSVVNSGAQAANKPIESEYSAAELANAARARFGVQPEVVSAALKLAGKDKATLTEAQRIVKTFKERKVK